MTKENEYSALRAEMLKRFDRIHDTMKYGLGIFIALIAYYHAYAPGTISSGIAICLFQLIFFSIGIIILQNYQSIYLEGTHIAICHENEIPHPWHRMSRHYGEFTNKNLPFLLGSRWGADSAVISYILLFIGIISWIETLTKPPITCESFISMLWLFLFAGVVTLANLVVLYFLTIGMKNYREKIENEWLSYMISERGKRLYSEPYSNQENENNGKIS